MPNVAVNCPGCRGQKFVNSYAVHNQPVILNYRFQSVSAAQSVARGNVRLLQCSACGLIFNGEFQANLIPYDRLYENTQCCSPEFFGYLERCAKDLIARYELRGKRILEVGCGKGDFLKLICKLGDNSGEGFDTTYEGPCSIDDPAINFHQEYINASRINEEFDLVLCRHVIEHVHNIGPFLQELNAIARAAGRPITFLETPRFEWIFEQGSFWDIFYEHCNYFTEPTLRGLCERAGFRVLRHAPSFGDQYQILELSADGILGNSFPPPSTISLDAFRLKVAKKQAKIVRDLLSAGAERGWAIWGAGAKGVALVNQLEFMPASFVIDSNPAKQGCVIPGSSIPIISPEDPRVRQIPAILIANPRYRVEIEVSLKEIRFSNAIIST